jgi:pimeloyl-ACP methyl ester carboxylesterase
MTDGSRVRFGYVDTHAGQVHYREAGSGSPVVLLHWTPGSSAQYSAVIQAFAAAGFRAIAPDLPGCGHSFRREGHWGIGDFAANLIECLDGWKFDRGIVAGGHLASEITIETALRQPARVGLAVLDGTPVWGEELRASILSRATPTPIELRESGEHLAGLWAQVWSGVRTWRPNAPWSPELGAYAMQLLKARMLAEFDMRPAQALLEYDIFGALEALNASRVPVLALTANDDPLTNCHEAVLARVAAATGYRFPGEHPVHRRATAGDYVAPIVERWRALQGVAR